MSIANTLNLDTSTQAEYEVEKILDKRIHQRRIQYLVKWKGYDDSENTWESLDNLQNCKKTIKEYEKSIAPAKRIPKKNTYSKCSLSILPNGANAKDYKIISYGVKKGDTFYYLIQSSSGEYSLLPRTDKRLVPERIAYLENCLTCTGEQVPFKRIRYNDA